MDNIMYQFTNSLIHNLSSQSTRKNRLDSILDPLQCMIQLSMLSICPPNTKLSIYNNIVKIQEPNISQGIQRWIYKDTKTDLLHLFTACQYFSLIYKEKLSLIKNKNQNLYDIIIYFSIKGLDVLINTYSVYNSNHIPQLLDIYKTILKNTLDTKKNNVTEIYEKISNLYTNEQLYIYFYFLLHMKKTKDKTIIYSINIFNKSIYEKISKLIRTNLNY